MKRRYNSDSSKLDRKIIERNRRMQMKSLCFNLSSLIPNNHKSPKEALSQPYQVDRAVIYIKELREKIDELKRRKELLLRIGGVTNETTSSAKIPFSRTPVLELRNIDSSLEVILISGMNKNFMIYQVLSVLEEEGADVVNVSLSIMGDKVFHTILSQVTSSRIGVDTSRVYMRLKELVY